MTGGSRVMDSTMARHCSVAVIDDRAFIVYQVVPWRSYDLEDDKDERVPTFKQPLENGRRIVQIAELKIENGNLVCNRDEQITIPD